MQGILIADDPQKWDFAAYTVKHKLELEPTDGRAFPVNTDGSTLQCCGCVSVEICSRIYLLCR